MSIWVSDRTTYVLLLSTLAFEDLLTKDLWRRNEWGSLWHWIFDCADWYWRKFVGIVIITYHFESVCKELDPFAAVATESIRFDCLWWLSSPVYFVSAVFAIHIGKCVFGVMVSHVMSSVTPRSASDWHRAINVWLWLRQAFEHLTIWAFRRSCVRWECNWLWWSFPVMSWSRRRPWSMWACLGRVSFRQSLILFPVSATFQIIHLVQYHIWANLRLLWNLRSAQFVAADLSTEIQLFLNQAKSHSLFDRPGRLDRLANWWRSGVWIRKPMEKFESIRQSLIDGFHVQCSHSRWCWFRRQLSQWAGPTVILVFPLLFPLIDMLSGSFEGRRPDLSLWFV
jgi:hypothetical protein